MRNVDYPAILLRLDDSPDFGMEAAPPHARGVGITVSSLHHRGEFNGSASTSRDNGCQIKLSLIVGNC